MGQFCKAPKEYRVSTKGLFEVPFGDCIGVTLSTQTRVQGYRVRGASTAIMVTVVLHESLRPFGELAA